MAGRCQHGFSESDSPATAGGPPSINDAAGNIQASDQVHLPVRGVLPKSIQLVNIRGLIGQRGHEKARFLFDLATKQNSLVTMLTETWLCQDMFSSEITMNTPGYATHKNHREIALHRTRDRAIAPLSTQDHRELTTHRV